MKTRNDAVDYVLFALGSVVDEFSVEQIDRIVDECSIILWLTGAPDDYDVPLIEPETFWRVVQYCA